jgi:16S rRNA (uracil1498-N3)-methyltransferase
MDLFIGTRINDQSFQISDSEFHHCVRVTRHREGDEIYVTDFEGMIFRCKIIVIEAQNLSAEIIDLYKKENISASKINIAISLTQSTDRFEWFVEKAVENGVHNIIPMMCQRTERSNFKKERLLKIIEASAKQTLRPIRPILHDLLLFDDAIKLFSDCPQKYFGHCYTTELPFLGKLYNREQDASLFIGPAGDFSEDEVQIALANQVIPVSLGDYRLRTETAGLTSLLILQTLRHL